MSLNVYALGASRNIGYHAALRLLRKGATVTFLLRSLSTLESDEQLQPFLKDRKAHLVNGDALNLDDVKRGWETAASNGPINLVMFTVGGVGHWELRKGFQLSTPDLCTRSFLNVLRTIRSSTSSPSDPSGSTHPQPKLIVVSSIGITRKSSKKIPLLLKPIYGYLLQGPHADKIGLERMLAYSAGWEWSDKDKVEPQILPEDWTSQFDAPGDEGSGSIESGWLKHLVVVRPALLTSGACRADSLKVGSKAPYRYKEGDLGDGYQISREDVAHFLVERVLGNWEEYENKGFEVAY